MAKSPYGRIGNFIVGSPKLDAKDISILKVFTENSRSALSKIRSAVSLSRDGID
jgi:DNA-binding Lrp family transcriptional regulator